MKNRGFVFRNNGASLGCSCWRTASRDFSLNGAMSTCLRSDFIYYEYQGVTRSFIFESNNMLTTGMFRDPGGY